MIRSLQSIQNQAVQNDNVYDLSFVTEADVWLANFTSQQTRRTYRTAVSQFIGFHSIRSMDDFVTMERVHVIAWRDALIADGESPRTICNRLSAISSLFKHLCDIQQAATNPTLGVKRPRVQKNQVEAQALTPQQVRSLLDAPDIHSLQGLRDRALLHVFFYTGCRVCENAIRPFVLGRKAWLFSVSTKGAKASANLYSLIETAKANGLEPHAYLKQVFTKLPNCDDHQEVEALLPWNLK